MYVCMYAVLENNGVTFFNWTFMRMCLHDGKRAGASCVCVSPRIWPPVCMHSRADVLYVRVWTRSWSISNVKGAWHPWHTCIKSNPPSNVIWDANGHDYTWRTWLSLLGVLHFTLLGVLHFMIMLPIKPRWGKKRGGCLGVLRFTRLSLFFLYGAARRAALYCTFLCFSYARLQIVK